MHILEWVTGNIVLKKSSKSNYLPATTMPSIIIVGEFDEYSNSKSLAKVIFLNISLKFPAIVISLMGYLNSPFSTRKPVAPTE